ncbi:MAG: RNA polymerase sigma factor [Frankia sp.]
MDGDGRLVLRARLGDRIALDEIYERYADAVHTVCLHVLGDAHYAQTATQTTFALAVQGRLSPLSDPERLCDWLAELARAASLNQPLLTRNMHTRMADGPVARDLDPIALLRSAVLVPAPPAIRTALARTFDTMAAKLAREAAAAGLPPVASLRPSFTARTPVERPMVVPVAPTDNAAAEPAVPAQVPAAAPVVLTKTAATVVDLVKRPVVVDLVKRSAEVAIAEPTIADPTIAEVIADPTVAELAMAEPTSAEVADVRTAAAATGEVGTDLVLAGESVADGDEIGHDLVTFVPRPRTVAVARPTLVNGAVVFPTRYPVEEDFFDGDTGPLPTIARTVAAPLPLPRDRYPGWDIRWMPVAREDAAAQARSGPRFAAEDDDENTLLADVSGPLGPPRPPARTASPELRLRPALTVAASLVIAIAGVTTAVNWPSTDLRVGSLQPGVPDVVAVVPRSATPSATAKSKTVVDHPMVVAGAYTDLPASGLSSGAALAVPMPFGSSTGDNVVIKMAGGKVVTTPAGKVSQKPIVANTPPVTVPPVTDDPAPPPVTVPPVTVPPVTIPPVTVPPVTIPPVTVPPVTDEPAPPVTVPPVTIPPVTVPPVTDPPVTQPAPVTEPPVTDAPADPTPSTANA